MKVEENIKLMSLFDAYGLLLSEGQQSILINYLYDDLTVTEIAQNLGVSRQAVMDSVTKAEKRLYELEEKLEFQKKFDALAAENEKLKKEIERLKKK